MDKNRGRPKKLHKLDEGLQIRVTSTEKQAFQQAADLAGIALSAWIRERLRSVAIRELEGAGYPVPFIQRIPLRTEHNA
jgi:hypothetical protein